MNTFSKIALVVLVVAVVAGGFALQQVGHSSTNPLVIGFVGPLSGDAAAYGVDDKRGMELAVAEINKAGGIGGRPIKAVYEDGQCSGPTALTAAQKLMQTDEAHYIVGGGCSGETFAMLPATTPAKALVISPSSTAGKLSGISPYFLRNIPSDNQPANALAGYVSKNYQTNAVIAEQTDYAQGLKSTFVAEAQKGGVGIVDTEDYISGTTDFRTLLVKVKKTNPESVFIDPQSGADVARIAKQARDLGITAHFVGINYMGPDVLAGGDAVEGFVAAVPPGLATDERGNDFMTKYKATYHTDPVYAFLAGGAYDDIYLLKQAIEKAGDDASKVADYLHAMPQYTGAIGTYHFDQNGDPVGINDVFQKIEGGKVVNL